MVYKKDFTRGFFVVCLMIFSGLSSSSSLADCSSCSTTNNCGDDARQYVLSSKYYRLSPPKKNLTVIEAVDPRYPDCNYRKVRFCHEEYGYQFYGRLAANGSQLHMGDLSSSEGTADFSVFGLTIPNDLPRGTLQAESSGTTTYGGELALGYLWEDVRAEAEYLYNSKTEHEATATLNPIPITILDPFIFFEPPNPLSGPVSVHLQTQTFLGNLYYDFMVTESIRPFVTCGLGLSTNTMSLSANIDSVTINTIPKRSYNFAYTGGLGVRIGVFSHCFLTASYRYMRLGTATTSTSAFSRSAVDGLVNISVPSLNMNKAELYQNTFSIGIMYLF